MNTDVLKYVKQHADRLNGRVLEVGSLNVNGSVREVLKVDIGIDMRPGNGVDRVMLAEDLPEHFGAEFDSMVSCDMLEHCENWRGAIRGMWHVLKPGGWMLVTMANMRKGRHNYPSDYWRCEPETLEKIFPGCVDMVTQSVSINWMIQKNGELPDLDKFEMLEVDKVSKWNR